MVSIPLLSGWFFRPFKDSGIRVALNPSPWNERAEKLPLDLADILFVNEIEGAGLADLKQAVPAGEILDKLCSRFPKKAASITVSRKGAMESIPFRNEVS